jgi:hypothetical protein
VGVQQHFWPDPQPLVTRLGQRFFREIPQHAGVYKMRDASERIVYVGKAKNLRQRLRSYRVADPERLPRRRMRLLHEVVRIEFTFCASESAALQHEAKLIRELKPKFNRAGVWQGKRQFFCWRFEKETVEFDVQETPRAGWERFGPLGSYTMQLRASLIRLLWLRLNPGKSFGEMPIGWAHSRMGNTLRLQCGERVRELRMVIENFFWGNQEYFANWLSASSNSNRSAFERTAISNEVSELAGFFRHYGNRQTPTSQMMLL